MAQAVPSTVAARVPCPICGKPLDILAELVPVAIQTDKSVLRYNVTLRDPRIVIDKHLTESPTCALGPEAT